ncbi:YeeE/YedE thiosulfate transporter family protein [Magnetococcus sp. PR-3]|uniref:YeeE/YedE thiosulfate transporter family protein n=1 Tax=Magnetococcus sp. PR-3 TaxID=3120355 RepID=UPI002FCE0150
MKSFFDFLHQLNQYLRTPFIPTWTPQVGALLLVMAMAVFLLNGNFWSVFAGIRYLGDAFNNWLGLGPLLDLDDHLLPPLKHRSLISDIAMVMGAMGAAMLAGQFRLSRPAPMEYVTAMLGGCFMGMGASLAGGCTVGGFFNPLVFSSPAGWMMLLGLMIGAALAIRAMIWAKKVLPWGGTPEPQCTTPLWQVRFTWLGWVPILGGMAWGVSWITQAGTDSTLAKRGFIVITALFLGVVLQRSRLCFAQAIREPFETGGGEYAKALMLAILLVTPLAALLITRLNIDPYSIIPPRFWWGSFFGGILFGVGMILGQGCAASSLWRLGEGNLKMLVSLFFFAWSGSISFAWLRIQGWLELDVDLDYLDGVPTVSDLGYQAFLPDLLDSWGLALTLTLGIIIIWFLLIEYNEKHKTFTRF